MSKKIITYFQMVETCIWNQILTDLEDKNALVLVQNLDIPVKLKH